MKQQVTLAYPYTDSEGKSHPAGASVSLDFFEARSVAASGVGRIKETKPAASADDKKAGK